MPDLWEGMTDLLNLEKEKTRINGIRKKWTGKYWNRHQRNSKYFKKILGNMYYIVFEFLDLEKPSKLNLKEINKLNRPIRNGETKMTIKSPLTKNVQGQIYSQ